MVNRSHTQCVLYTTVLFFIYIPNKISCRSFAENSKTYTRFFYFFIIIYHRPISFYVKIQATKHNSSTGRMLNIFLSSCFPGTNFRPLIAQSTGRLVVQAGSPLFCIPALLFLQKGDDTQSQYKHKKNV